MTILNLKDFYLKNRQHLVNFSNGTLFFKRQRALAKVLVILLDKLLDEAPKVMAQTKAAVIQMDSDFV